MSGKCNGNEINKNFPVMSKDTFIKSAISIFVRHWCGVLEPIVIIVRNQSRYGVTDEIDKHRHVHAIFGNVQKKQMALE